MHALTMPTKTATRKELASATPGERLTISIQWFASGLILAAIALVVDTAFDGMVVAAAVRLDGEGQCAQYLSDGPIIATLVASVVTSLLVGYWLFGLRKWIGAKDEYHDPAWTAYLRSRFVAGAMPAFLLFCPVKLIVLLSFTICFGHMNWV